MPDARCFLSSSSSSSPLSPSSLSSSLSSKKSYKVKLEIDSKMSGPHPYSQHKPQIFIKIIMIIMIMMVIIMTIFIMIIMIIITIVIVQNSDLRLIPRCLRLFPAAVASSPHKENHHCHRHHYHCFIVVIVIIIVIIGINVISISINLSSSILSHCVTYTTMEPIQNIVYSNLRKESA